MIKILNIINSLEVGGAEIMLQKILINTDDTKFKHIIVTLKSKKKLLNDFKSKNIEIHSLKINNFVNFLKSFKSLLEIVKNINPDYILTWLHPSDFYGLFIKFMYPEVTLIWNIRCSKLIYPIVDFKNILLVKILSKLSKYPDLIISNSFSGIKEHLRLGYKPKEIKVIPNGFDMKIYSSNNSFRKLNRRKFTLNQNDFVIGFVGKYNRIKGIEKFILTANIALKKFSNWKFVLMGRDLTYENNELVNQLKKYKILKNFRLLGERQDVNKILCSFDILSLTSSSEGFPNVIGEAMSCGVPCVSTDVGDCKLIIDETGIISKNHKPQHIFNDWLSIYKMLKNDSSKLKKSARARIKKYYEINFIIKQYEKLFVKKTKN